MVISCVPRSQQMYYLHHKHMTIDNAIFTFCSDSLTKKTLADQFLFYLSVNYLVDIKDHFTIILPVNKFLWTNRIECFYLANCVFAMCFRYIKNILSFLMHFWNIHDINHTFDFYFLLCIINGITEVRILIVVDWKKGSLENIELTFEASSLISFLLSS